VAKRYEQAELSNVVSVAKTGIEPSVAIRATRMRHTRNFYSSDHVTIAAFRACGGSLWGVFMSGEIGNQGVSSRTSLLLNASKSLPWWVRIVVVLGALLMAMGAGIALLHPAMLVSPHDDINGAVRVYAGYLVSRNFALAVLLLVSMGLRARGRLNSLALLTACIQILDAGVDCWEGRWAIVPGIVVFSVMFFAASARLCGHPFWRVEAWRQS
jgi:hypothetical protein